VFVCVCVCGFECMCVYICMCVSEREREGEVNLPTDRRALSLRLKDLLGPAEEEEVVGVGVNLPEDRRAPGVVLIVRRLQPVWVCRFEVLVFGIRCLVLGFRLKDLLGPGV